MIYKIIPDITITNPILDKYLIGFYSGDSTVNKEYKIKATSIVYHQNVNDPIQTLMITMPRKGFNISFDNKRMTYLTYNHTNTNGTIDLYTIYKFDRLKVNVIATNINRNESTEPFILDFEIQDFSFENNGMNLIIKASDDIIQLNRYPKIALNCESGITIKDIFKTKNIIPVDSNWYKNYFDINNIFDGTIGVLQIPSPSSPLEILKTIKNAIHITFVYLRHNYPIDGSMKFYCGWKYWDNSQIIDWSIPYVFKYPYNNIDKDNKDNILPIFINNLTFNNKNKWNTLVQGTFQTKNKTDLDITNTTTYTLYYPNLNNDFTKKPDGFFEDIININLKDGIQKSSNIPGLATGESIILETWNNLPIQGWIGSFTMFGSPNIRIGDIVNIINLQGVNNSNNYYVQGVDLSLTTSGWRRTITIDSTSSININSTNETNKNNYSQYETNR